MQAPGTCTTVESGPHSSSMVSGCDIHSDCNLWHVVLCTPMMKSMPAMAHSYGLTSECLDADQSADSKAVVETFSYFFRPAQYDFL